MNDKVLKFIFSESWMIESVLPLVLTQKRCVVYTLSAIEISSRFDHLFNCMVDLAVISDLSKQCTIGIAAFYLQYKKIVYTAFPFKCY